MGVSIELKIYDTKELFAKLSEIGADAEQTNRWILEQCGVFTADKYVILYNDYWDGYNPVIVVSNLIDRRYGIDDSFDVLLKVAESTHHGGVDEYDVAERLGIPEREPEEDEE